MILLNPFRVLHQKGAFTSGFTGGYSYSATSWLVVVHEALSEPGYRPNAPCLMPLPHAPCPMPHAPRLALCLPKTHPYPSSEGIRLVHGPIPHAQCLPEGNSQNDVHIDQTSGKQGT
jgi:hypothetical protein